MMEDGVFKKKNSFRNQLMDVKNRRGRGTERMSPIGCFPRQMSVQAGVGLGQSQ